MCIRDRSRLGVAPVAPDMARALLILSILIIGCGGTGSEDDIQGAVPVTQGSVPTTHPGTNPVTYMPKESATGVSGQTQATEAAPLPAPANATAPAPSPAPAPAPAMAPAPA